jgi:predicted thioredoxin/glutaredoxin
MATLIYSDQCINCYELIEYIKTKPALHTIVKYHHINEGVPNGVTKVPSLITSDGNLYVGNQVKTYLQSLIPNKIEKFQYGKISSKRLDNQNLGGKYFSVRNYGNNIINPDPDERVNIPVNDALASLKR